MDSREQQRIGKTRSHQRQMAGMGYGINHPHNQFRWSVNSWSNPSPQKISEENKRKLIETVNEMQSIGWAVLCVHKLIQRRKDYVHNSER